VLAHWQNCRDTSRIRELRPALADFNRLLTAQPSLAAAYDYRARVRHALGDEPGALADLRRALSLSSQSGAYVRPN